MKDVAPLKGTLAAYSVEFFSLAFKTLFLLYLIHIINHPSTRTIPFPNFLFSAPWTYATEGYLNRVTRR